MFKKILISILFVAVIGAGSFGTYHFYKENKANISAYDAERMQKENLQAQLNQIGTMTTTYAVATDLLSGDEIKDTDIIEVHIPTSAVASNGYDTSVNPDARASLIGRKVRCKISANTILTPDMLMTETEEETGLLQYPVELTFNSLPVTLEVGDYVDLRLLLANGEEYVVFDHKIVQAIYNNTVTFYITEEENAIINSLYSDLGVYSQCCVAYLFKYLEPGNKQTLSFYPVVTEMEEFLMYNPNITDITRCVNTNLRDHINEQLLMLSNSANSGTSSAVLSSVSSAMSGQSSMRQQWLQNKEQEESTSETVTDGTTEGTVEDTSTVDLEAIE